MATNTPVTFRQGDVLLVRAPEACSGVEMRHGEANRIVLARGETTGHLHAFDGEDGQRVEWSFYDDGGRYNGDGLAQTITVPDGGATLRHGTPEKDYADGDHAPLHVPTGTYVVRRQRELRGRAGGVD